MQQGLDRIEGKGNMEKKTGIFKRESDTLQPYRVWYDGHIVYFAKTLDEAVCELAKEKAGHWNPTPYQA